LLRASPLRGFNIPGATDRIITTLFTDNTTIYLSKMDDYSTLQSILSTWCTASSARFNTSKTEIIPIGSPEYREQLIDSRALSPLSLQFPSSARIAQDGDSVRILGAWIGNEIDQEAPWTIVLNKIRASLDRWKKGHPSLRGKCLIIQMIVGGMTQYLTTVQGMPTHIEKILTTIIHRFIWHDSCIPPIKLDTLHLPRTQGGLDLLDLHSRNNAIDLQWLRPFLNLTPSRPTWAYVADLLISDNITKSSGQIDKTAQKNIVLQSWRAGLHSTSHLPSDILRMLCAGESFGLNFEAIKLSPTLKKKLPFWHHVGAKLALRRLNNSRSAQCLRQNHEVLSVGDMMCLTKRTRHPALNPPH
ncbi:hypothetical protein BKA93DRAFT_744739, partial [Sparassis latifolia]